MRVTSDLFIAALLRRVFSAGGYGAIERRGFDAAGAIFIRQRDRFGQYTLYGPSSQASYPDPGKPQDRSFARLMTGDDEQPIARRMESEIAFDTDLWLVEIELERDVLEGMMEVEAEG